MRFLSALGPREILIITKRVKYKTWVSGLAVIAKMLKKYTTFTKDRDCK